jgi:uncharacterized protein (UPF0332 family)
LPLDPNELLQHSDALAAKAGATQADLRRAISAAYYAIFHFTLAAAAEMVLGTSSPSTPGYSLVYRSVDHSRLRGLCDQLRGTKPGSVAITPTIGFGRIADFARVTFNLYEQRILADYEPSRDFTVDEAKIAISDAREAIAWFQTCTDEQQKAFLTMLLFRPR